MDSLDFNLRVMNKNIKLLNRYISVMLMILFANMANAQNSLATQQFTINGVNYQLEIAQTHQQLQIGLMGRTSLMLNKGMLFVFPNFRRHGIWMKNMSIPLTVAWLDQQFKVIHVQKLYPCKTRQCPIANPFIYSAYVIELNLNNKISIGDQIITH